MESALTPTEEKILDLLVEAHNEFVPLETQHPQEKSEWISHLHGLQSIIALRALRRLYPEIFPIKL